MKNLFLILAISICISCNDDSDTNNLQYYNISASIDLSVFDEQNKDLLDLENPNHWDTSNFKVFYVVDGETHEYYEPNLDYPKGYRIYKHENEYRLSIFLNHSEKEETPITYIKWNEDDTDTIAVSYQRTEYSVLQNIVWLNGEKVWERGDNTIDPYFLLRK